MKNSSKKIRIFCHCHVFYPELWQELKTCLLNLAAVAELKVTVTAVRELPEIQKDCQHYFPGSTFQIVPNSGYDILPFFRVYDMIEPEEFDLVLKLHTKRDYPQFCYHVNYYSFCGSKWRRGLLEFLSTPRNTALTLQCFEDPAVGMVGNGRLWCDYERDGIPWNKTYIKDELRYLGMKTPKRAFLSGTMFICRPEVLKFFHRKVDYDRLQTSNDHSISVVHCYEMLFGCALAESGLLFCDYANRPPSKLHGGAWRKLYFRILWKVFLLSNKFCRISK